MANEYVINAVDAIGVADVIREESQISEQLLFPDGWKTAIRAIQGNIEKPQLIISAPIGSSIVAENGTKSLTGMVGEEGSLTLDLPSFGVWEVTATLDGQQSTMSINVERNHPLSLSYITVFTINGAYNETVTIADGETELYTTTLNSSGIGLVQLNCVGGKTLTFTGGTSGHVTTVEVGIGVDAMTVNVYPAGALYWYGREFTEVTGGWSSGHNGSNSFSATKKSDGIYLSGSYSSGSDASHGGIGTTNKVNVQNYKTLYALVNVTNDCQGSFFSVGSNKNNVTAYAEGSSIANTSGFATTTGVKTVKLTSITYAAHVGVTITVGANYGKDGSAIVYAVWGE